MQDVLPQLNYVNFISQLFWLFLTFFILYFFLSRVTLPRIRTVLQDRESKILGDLEQARIMKDDAEAARSQYTSSLEHAKNTSSELIKNANEFIAQEIKARHAELDVQLEKQLSEAETKIEQLRMQTKKELENVSHDIAELMIDRIISNNGASETRAKSA